MLPHPASPPFPPRPGRFPGRRRAAGHSHHPAAASPALHPGVRCLPLRTDAGHDLLRGLVPDGGCLRVRSLPHRPGLESLARRSSAGEEQVPGEPVAGAALHPGLAGAGAHAPGTAGGPRHLHHRHRPKAHRARRAVERQPLPRDLQPLLLQLPAPHPPCPGYLLPVRREEGRGPGGENHLLLVPAAGAELLHAPVPQGEAPVPEERRGALADPGEGRLRRQEHPQRQQRLSLLPAGFPALLGSSLPPHPPLLHQHQTCLSLCPLCYYGPDRLPPGLPAQLGLRLDEAKLPSGGGGRETLPAAPPRPQGFLRRVAEGHSLGCPLARAAPKPRWDLRIAGSPPQPGRSWAGSLWTLRAWEGRKKAQEARAGLRQRWGLRWGCGGSAAVGTPPVAPRCWRQPGFPPPCTTQTAKPVTAGEMEVGRAGRRMLLFYITSDAAVGSSRSIQVPREEAGGTRFGNPQTFQQPNIDCDYPREGDGSFWFVWACFGSTFCQGTIPTPLRGSGEGAYK